MLSQEETSNAVCKPLWAMETLSASTEFRGL